MPLLTEQDFRNLYVPKTATAINSEQILKALRTARNDLVKLVGLPAVTDAELTTPTNAERAQTLRDAQDLLARRQMLGTRSTRFTDYGIMSASKDANSQLTNSYEKYSEIRKEKDDLMAEAMGILGVYLLSNEVELIQSDEFYHSSVHPIAVNW